MAATTYSTAGQISNLLLLAVVCSYLILRHEGLGKIA